MSSFDFDFTSCKWKKYFVGQSWETVMVFCTFNCPYKVKHIVCVQVPELYQNEGGCKEEGMQEKKNQINGTLKGSWKQQRAVG